MMVLIALVSIGAGLLTGTYLQSDFPSGDLSDNSFNSSIENKIDSEEGVYSLLPLNESNMLGGEGSDVPLFAWNTNGKGLREEQFSEEKPVNTTRILVLGDSITAGWGVNVSDRYTDLLEEKLNSNDSIQVINAGVPGWGMKDYSLFLEHRGVNYEPDVVVVAFAYPQDAYNREKAVSFYKKANASVDESKMSGKVGRIDPDKRDKVQERLAELQRDFYSNLTFESSNVPGSMQNIVTVSRNNDIEPVFYGYQSIGPEKEKIRNWFEERNVSYIWAPKKLDIDRENSDKYRFENDPHYNPEGHKVLAQKLTAYFRENQVIDPESGTR